MTAFHDHVSVRTTAGIDILDITEHTVEAVRKSRVRNGQLCIFIGGSTGSVTTIEYEPGVVRDLRRTLEKIAPRDAAYEHDKAWGDGNGYSHVLAALLGPSRVFPILDGRLPLGTWQQIVLVDLDNKPRERRILFQIVGE